MFNAAQRAQHSTAVAAQHRVCCVAIDAVAPHQTSVVYCVLDGVCEASVGDIPPVTQHLVLNLTLTSCERVRGKGRSGE